MASPPPTLTLERSPGTPRPSRSSGRSRWLRAAVAIVVGVAILGVRDIAPAAAATRPGTTLQAELEFARLLNKSRRSQGLKDLLINDRMTTQARSWSKTMRDAGTIFHTSRLASDTEYAVPSWSRAGENVGVGWDVQGLHDAFWNSPGHRANMLGDYNQVGVGVVFTSDRTYVTFRFAKGPVPSWAGPVPYAETVGVRRGTTYYLRTSNTAGDPDLSFTLGRSTDQSFVGDWNADGKDTPGIRRGNTFYLYNKFGGSPAATFTFGKSTDKVVVGDWNGDGKDNIGLRRGTTWLLRNRNSTGSADIKFTWGTTGGVPVAGDWNDDGRDTVGLRKGTSWVLRATNASSSKAANFSFGLSTDRPIVGDWNGDGRDTVGARRGTTVLLRNSNSSGGASLSFDFGLADDLPLAGTWKI